MVVVGFSFISITENPGARIWWRVSDPAISGLEAINESF